MELNQGKPSDINLRKNFIPIKSSVNWDQYFMLQAMLASFKSKDPNTKVGSVFVDENNHQVTMGYNGFIAGIDESQLPWGNDLSVPKEFQKYGYVVHSEANAILHASKSLDNCRGYVTLFPCEECAKLIASKKIKEVIYLSDKYSNTEGNRIAKRIFDLAKIPYRRLELDNEIIENLNTYLLSMINKL
jgi:dCMP deaminase